MSERVLWLLRDARRARKQGVAGMLRRQRARLVDIVAFARHASPYYRELYQHLPHHVEDHTLLPVTMKKALMTRFDDWVTDPEVTIEQARAFINRPVRVGQRLLGRYLVFTSSGTTGDRGIFLMDDRNRRVSSALIIRMVGDWLTAGDVTRIIGRGGRAAVLIATEGHFAGVVTVARLSTAGPVGSRTLRVFSVHTPLSELVARLNGFRPAIVAGYASTVALLAGEQAAGRLHINPVLVQPTSEGLPAGAFDRIAAAFDAKVRTAYNASECLAIGHGCEYGWQHVNSDWVVLEPVDADYRPVPAGEQSHTVLLSNLANRVQPLLRYDLGDAVLARPDPCPCGKPPPAIRVQGRAGEVLSFPIVGGGRAAITPLALGTLIERTPDVAGFQIVQTAPTRLRLRLRLEPGTDTAQVWQTVYADIRRLLTEHQLDHVTVERAEEPPEQSRGGKYQTVIPLR